jgi:hypothetical protein
MRTNLDKFWRRKRFHKRLSTIYELKLPQIEEDYSHNSLKSAGLHCGIT